MRTKPRAIEWSTVGLGQPCRGGEDQWGWANPVGGGEAKQCFPEGVKGLPVMVFKFVWSVGGGLRAVLEVLPWLWHPSKGCSSLTQICAWCFELLVLTWLGRCDADSLEGFPDNYHQPSFLPPTQTLCNLSYIETRFSRLPCRLTSS